MLRVRCQASATLDDKGRLMLPGPIRREVERAGGALVFTYCRGALWGWSRADFEAIEARALPTDPLDVNGMAFAHAFLAPAQDVDMDAQGRIRIPPTLRELAGLERDIMVNGLLNRVELWDRARWEEHFKASLERLGALPGVPGWGGA
jgi:MraZ protein